MILVPRGRGSRARGAEILNILYPLGGHVGSIFRSWALLGRILRLLLRLFSLLAGFCASWGAPASILEGSGTLWGGFWRPQGRICRCFLVHTRLQCVNSPTAISYWKNQYETHVGHPACDAKIKQNSILEPVKQSCPQRSCYKLVLELAGLGFGGDRASLGCLLGVTWPAFAGSGAPFGLSWAALGQFLGALGRLFVGLGRFLGAFWLPGPPRA